MKNLLTSQVFWAAAAALVLLFAFVYDVVNERLEKSQERSDRFAEYKHNFNEESIADFRETGRAEDLLDIDARLKNGVTLHSNGSFHNRDWKSFTDDVCGQINNALCDFYELPQYPSAIFADRNGILDACYTDKQDDPVRCVEYD